MLTFVVQPQGPGKYVFDIGCQQVGEYVLDQEVNEQVLSNCTNYYLLLLLLSSSCTIDSIHYL